MQAADIYIPGQPSDTAVYKYQDRPWYAKVATNTDAQKQDADEKGFVTQVTKLITAQMNLGVQTVEDTWQELTIVKL